MTKALSQMVGFVLILVSLFAAPCWARDPGDWFVVEKINIHGFTWTEQVVPGRGRMATGTLGSVILLSNCPRKGCVILSGTFNFVGDSAATLLLEGSECRPTVATVDVNGMLSNDIVLTIPSDPACAGVPHEASGRYFAICQWDAPYGDLSWTGWHKNYKCWPQSGKGFPVGPR